MTSISEADLSQEALLNQARELLRRIDAVDEVLAAELAQTETQRRAWLDVLQAAGLDTPDAVQAHLAGLSADERRDAEQAGSEPNTPQEK